MDIDLSDMPIFLRIFGMNTNKNNRTYERKTLDIIWEIWYNIIVEINKNSYSEKENWKADIGIATDKFITFIENATESIFVNVPKAKAKLAELNAKRTDRV